MVAPTTNWNTKCVGVELPLTITAPAPQPAESSTAWTALRLPLGFQEPLVTLPREIGSPGDPTDALTEKFLVPELASGGVVPGADHAIEL